MSSPPNPINVRFPFELKDQPHEVQQAHRYAFQGLVDLNQAIASISSQVSRLKPSVPSGKTIVGSTSVTVITGSTFAGLGAIRDETGVTAYTNIAADNGILLILNDASPVAITLDSAMVTPYFLFITNFGAGTATLTPTSGTINGSASFSLPQNYTAVVVFNGTNWFTSAVLVIPQTIAPVAGKYLTAYDAATGLFSQSTTPGISATITTAALTTLGTQGSMTFVDGILTAQTPAT